MLAIYIDSIGDKSVTYKLLRNYSSLSLSLIQSRIKNHDTVMEVDILDLDELKKVRALIHDLSDIWNHGYYERFDWYYHLRDIK